MVDVEFRVLSDRRDGLLLALGQLVIANGYTLLRQRMLNTAEGVVLTMVVRGTKDGLMPLEERLATHPLVLGFEAITPDSLHDSRVTATHVAVAAAPARIAPARGEVDPQRVEALLPLIAREYPDIFVRLLALESELPPAQRESTLRYIGHRVGHWVYRRDYVLGSRLSLADAVRHIALPAMRQIVQADLHEDTFRIRNSPFVDRGEHGACCHFIRGMLGGLLAGPDGAETVDVVESQCRNTGADACCFEIA